MFYNCKLSTANSLILPDCQQQMFVFTVSLPSTANGCFNHHCIFTICITLYLHYQQQIILPKIVIWRVSLLHSALRHLRHEEKRCHLRSSSSALVIICACAYSPSSLLSRWILDYIHESLIAWSFYLIFIFQFLKNLVEQNIVYQKKKHKKYAFLIHSYIYHKTLNICFSHILPEVS